MGFIFFNTLKGHRYPLLVTALLLVGFGVVIAASYESIEGSGFLGQQMPKGISAFLKAEGALLLASGPQGYLAVAFRHPIFLVVLSSFAIATASGALAREIEHRTILILLARPLPRYRLVLGRGLEAATLLVVLVFALLVGTLIGASAAGIMGDVRLGPLLLASLNGLCLTAAIMGYSFLLSALSSDGARAILFATA
ncbi:MAG: ABC transporter permease subunit, partial [Chloroflexi bacterium]|nr:ABC transporter permease subunit [Chloroflexota bacterium]